MNKAFKILFVLLLFCHNSYAQNMSYGITSGVVLSHPKDYHTHIGFNIGMKGIFSLSENPNKSFIELQLKFISKGWKDDIYYSMSNKQEWSCNAYYLELLLHFGYKYSIKDNFSIFGSFGPYIALGLFGNSTLKDYEDFNINNIFSDQVYKRFDYGIGANIGIEINHHWQIGMGVSFSLLKPTKGEWNAINPKDLSFNTSLAYIF